MSRGDEVLFVYVAGPYTKGDVAVNVRNAILTGMRLRKLGMVPFVPHQCHIMHMIQPEGYEFWMNWDLDMLTRFDAVLRLAGESAGADREEARAEELGIPVFHTVEELVEYQKIREQEDRCE